MSTTTESIRTNRAYPIIVLLFATALFLTMAHPAFAVANVDVFGTVSAADSGAGLQNVRVDVITVTNGVPTQVAATAMSDESGIWVAAVPADGLYIIRYSVPGGEYATLYYPNSATASGATRVEVGAFGVYVAARLQHSASITGDFVDLYSGTGISNNEIILSVRDSDAQWQVLATVYSDGNGAFMFDGLNPGSYIVAAGAAESDSYPYTSPTDADGTSNVLELAANQSANVSIGEYRDSEAPRTFTNLSQDSVRAGAVVRLMASDDRSGVAQTFYRLNGRALTAGASMTLTKLGLNTIEFYSVDAAGNVEQAQKSTVYVKSVRQAKTRPIKR
ncbi:MAG: hypothetical protein KJ747_00040 [Actinobacteria bacterium]|nr:hypothetical protein [Actinomycetota bacterium]MCG2808104.1 hypothetical protein [Coriobacteriia bacterium]